LNLIIQLNLFYPIYVFQLFTFYPAPSIGILLHLFDARWYIVFVFLQSPLMPYQLYGSPRVTGLPVRPASSVIKKFQLLMILSSSSMSDRITSKTD